MSPPERARELFDRAVDLPAAERRALLDGECAGEPELRRLIEELVAADAASTGGLGAAAAEPLDAAWAAGWIGRRCGPYRLLQLLGHGGMGHVFLAERADGSFDKKVAVKLLSVGLGRRSLARFRTERRVLARLEHPNIARLLDGGSTPEGIPYLVMEYVSGRPVTEACDQGRWPIRRRLELVTTICGAVQHAHRNLVVHRDLKPSNLLVTGDGEPKLLDFGIAKLTEQAGEPSATVTERPGRAFTPRYASPEQLAGQPVTTATDVYSLGVLLYELLVGEPPFPERGAGGGASRPALDQRSPAPSVAFRRLGAARREAIASARGAGAAQLGRRLAGDLDVIVGKALAPEPARRYGAAGELQEDLRRHLHGLPVEARPAGLGYRFGKLVRRHRTAATAVALALLALVAVAITGTVQSRRVARQRDEAQRQRARAEQVTSLLLDSFRLADPQWSRGEEVTAREILDNSARQITGELSGEGDVEIALETTVGAVYANLGLLDRAEPLLRRSFDAAGRLPPEQSRTAAAAFDAWGDLMLRRRALEEARQVVERALVLRRREDEPAAVAESLHLLGRIAAAEGRWREALVHHQEAVALDSEHLGSDHPSTIEGLRQLATALRDQGATGPARSLYTEALARQRRRLPGDQVVTARLLMDLARVEELRDDLELARRQAQDALEMSRRLYGPDHLLVAACLNQLGNVARLQGDRAEASRYYREGLATRVAVLGEDNPRIATAMYNLATLLHRDFGRLEEAEPLYRRAVELYQRGPGDEHPTTGFFKLGLGRILTDLGRPGEAEPILREAIRIFARHSKGGAEGRNASSARSALAGALLELERYDEAEALLLASHPMLAASYGDDHRITQRAVGRLVRLYRETGREAEAARYRALLASP